MDKLPTLTVDGKFTLGQSKAIERYLAKKFGLSGSSDEEFAKVDMICEHVRDIKQKYSDSKIGKTSDEATAAKSAFIANEVPKLYAKLEKCCETTYFSVGGKISLADIATQQFAADYADDKAGMAQALAGLPKLSSIVDDVSHVAKSVLNRDRLHFK